MKMQSLQSSSFLSNKVVIPKKNVSSRSSRTMVKVEAHKVAVLGAAGGIGQPLSLLMKLSPTVTELRCYDVMNVYGVAEDLSHINTPAKVKGYQGDAELAAALKGAEVVIIPAGVPRKPGMTRDDLFNINAGIVAGLAEACAKHCPNAILNIISNPVNSTVPIALEIYKKHGVPNPEKKIIGVTTLDVLRANTFVAEAKGVNVKDLKVPVVGGHAGVTILPLLSQANPKVSFDDKEADAMTKKIQDAGTVVVEKKEGKGSATLSMARAAQVMAETVLAGLDGKPAVEYAYVHSKVTDLPYFATRVRFGKSGVEEVMPLEPMSAFEKKAFEELKPMLKDNIDKGIAFAQSYKGKSEPVAA